MNEILKGVLGQQVDRQGNEHVDEQISKQLYWKLV
jgi:hypothetical protein